MMSTAWYGKDRALVFPRPFSRVSCLLAAALLTFVLPAAAQDYLLGGQDKLTVRVVEWQTIEGTFRSWDAVNGDYTVAANGNISLPFLGQVSVEGRTTADVASEIGEALQQKFGLSDRPEASVELLEHRPFYVSGEVTSPGRYPYVPDLNVLKAVSIAGGTRRPDYGMRAERDVLTAKGNAEVFADEQVRLLVRRARIVAEVEGADSFDTPQEIADRPDAESIMEDERAIMSSRQNRQRLRLEALEDLKQLLTSEIETLQQKTTTQERQIDLERKELESIGSLADQGLVVNTRVLAAERSIADLEGRLLDFETAILRARQDFNRAEQDAIELENSMDAELATDRQRVEAELIAVNLKLETQRGLMSEALNFSTMSALIVGEGPMIAYKIVRTTDGETRELSAREDTPVLPGDIVKIEPLGVAIQ
ncbi:polysaccharide biosynthesis/export family protein [Aliihoeflea sp. PC F10.4]